MWPRVRNLILLFCLLPALSWGAPQNIATHQFWSGKVELAGPLQVGPGGLLEIAPGTEIKVLSATAKLTVQGRLLVLGSAAAPVVFSAPKNWLGIEFIEAEADSRIEYAQFSSCREAISLYATSPQLRHNRFEDCAVAVQLLRESKSLLENNHFINNRIGLKVSMRSEPQVINNHFEQQTEVAMEVSNSSRGDIAGNRFTANKVGLSLQRTFVGRVLDNQFENNQVGLYSYQGRNTTLIEGNLFTGNQVGLSAFSFSYPAVRNNRFIENHIGLRNDQFGSTLVEYNQFRDNETAIYNNRKSNPQVQNNRFENNHLVLFCDYSSYPEVKQNNFLANQQVAELGLYQSADWEKRAGSKQLVRQQALERNSRNPLLEQAPSVFSDRVDLSGNWWGSDTSRLAAAGSDANLEIFYDRRDKPQVSYPGYGEESYQLDLVIYAPWLEQPVAESGPQESP